MSDRMEWAAGDAPTQVTGTVNDATGTLQPAQVATVTFTMTVCGAASPALTGTAEVVGANGAGGVDVAYTFDAAEVAALGRALYMARWRVVTTDAGTFSAPGDRFLVIAVT